MESSLQTESAANFISILNVKRLSGAVRLCVHYDDALTCAMNDLLALQMPESVTKRQLATLPYDEDEQNGGSQVYVVISTPYVHVADRVILKAVELIDTVAKQVSSKVRIIPTGETVCVGSQSKPNDTSVLDESMLKARKEEIFIQQGRLYIF